MRSLWRLPVRIRGLLACALYALGYFATVLTFVVLNGIEGEGEPLYYIGAFALCYGWIVARPWAIAFPAIHLLCSATISYCGSTPRARSTGRRKISSRSF